MFGSQKMHLHIVSKDKITVARIKKELQHKSDVEIETYKTGEQFLGAMSQYSASTKTMPIVLLDYKLKSREYEHAKDGMEVMAEMKKMKLNYGIIMITEPEHATIKNKAIKAGAFACLRKNDNLLLRLSNYIENFISEENFKKEKKLNKVSFISFGVALFVFGVTAAILSLNT